MATRKTCACATRRAVPKRQTARSRRTAGQQDAMYERFTGLKARRAPARARAKDDDDWADNAIKSIPKIALAGATAGMIMGIGAGMAGAASQMGHLGS